MLFYQWFGRQEKSAPVIVLSAGLGGQGTYWEPQLSMLAPFYRILLYDHLGTGRTGSSVKPGYSVHDMASEVLELLDDQNISCVDFMGHAFGSLVGLTLARIAPQRINRLVIAGGWVSLDAHTQQCFDIRLALLRECGIDAYLKAQPFFLFPAAWLSAHAHDMAQSRQQTRTHLPEPATIEHRIEALSAFDASDWIASIKHETLVITTYDDMLIPWTASEALATALPRGEFTCLAYGGHACSVTEPDDFNNRVQAFLTR